MTRFGSSPHDERVLAVVLVTTADADAPPVATHVLEPHTPEWDAFWHDIGRPEEGLNGTSKAPESGECVQPACPTALPTCQECGRVVRQRFGAWWCEVHRDRGHVILPGRKWTRVPPPEPASKDSFRDGVSAGWSASQRRDPFPEEAEPACPACDGKGREDEGGACDGRGKRFVYGAPWTSGHIVPCPAYVKARSNDHLERLEGIGPLDHPYPEEGTT